MSRAMNDELETQAGQDPEGPVRHHCDHYAGHRYPHLRRPQVRR